MGDINNHVSITITRDNVGVARQGFGTPMVLSANAAWVERTRTYASLSEVAADFPSTTGPEYLAATAIFSQSPHPKTMKIGRLANKPTMVKVIEVSTVRNSYAYSVHVKGDGVTASTATYTSDGTATNDEIVAGLVTAINAVAANNYLAAATGTAGSQVVTITADAVANWFSVEIADPTSLEGKQTHVDPGVAADLTAILLADSSWYGFTCPYNSNAVAIAAAAWAQANKRLFVVDTDETETITTSVGNSETADDLATLDYTYSPVFYHPAQDQMAGSAWLGRCLPLTPGSETWKFKTLAGVAAVAMTSTQRANLVARDANSYEEVAGISMTFNGTVPSGEYVDVIRGLDALEDDIKKSVFQILVDNDKVPYTDAGINLIEAPVRGALKRWVATGLLASDPVPAVSSPLVADVASGDKSARLLPDIAFNATLAGAIHAVDIVGKISV